MSHHPIRVVAIMSLGHSGSTLLDLMVSSHPQIVSVGEIHQLHASYTGQCTCSAPSIWECPFWKEVDSCLGKDGLNLRELDVNSSDPSAFRRHNIALVAAVSAVSGCSCIVDSSKSLQRLLRLARLQEIDLRVIQLERTVFGVVYSHMKKGRRLAREAGRWSRHAIRMATALRPLEPLKIKYADLATHPEATLRRVMEHIEIEYCPSQLNWACSSEGDRRLRHNVDGNRMRFSTESIIRPDVQWRSALSIRQKALIGLIVGVDRLLYPTHYAHALMWRRHSTRDW